MELDGAHSRPPPIGVPQGRLLHAGPPSSDFLHPLTMRVLKTLPSGTWGVAGRVKHLLHKLEYLSLDPQHTRKMEPRSTHLESQLLL